MTGALAGHPPAGPPDVARTIPGVLRAAAGTFAATEAVVDGGERPTFADIAQQVEEVERALLASGVRRGDRVAIWAPNGLAWIVVSFATYGVGAVLVPVNTRYRGEEAASLLRAAEVQMLFTVTDFLDTDYVALLDQAGGRDALREIVVLSGTVPQGTTSWTELRARAAAVPAEVAHQAEAQVRPEDPSDIIFTSGTTGLPKGAVLRHGASVETYVQWSRGVGVRHRDRVLMVYPFFHTAGLKSGILASFIRGATIVPHPVFDVPSVAARVRDEAITVLPGPPSVFQAILAHPDLASFQLGSLRLSVTGAAVVPVELISAMRSMLHLETVVTAYGLTETHGTATICEQDDPVETIATTVGHPLRGLDIRTVDDAGNDVPPGEPGEVVIRGFNVMSGYFHAPEATAGAVVDGWLHTGDVGIMRPDGYLRIVDRKKDIVIVGGFNVSPAEVEAMVLRRPEVAQVAVVGAPDRRLGEVPVAFVVLKQGHAVEPAALLAWCHQHMANFKVPRAVHLVDALPVNASGKVVKAALRARLAELAELAAE